MQTRHADVITLATAHYANGNRSRSLSISIRVVVAVCKIAPSTPETVKEREKRVTACSIWKPPGYDSDGSVVEL